MKKIICIVSAITAICSFAAFAFYFFKLNPEYCPCKRKYITEEE